MELKVTPTKIGNSYYFRIPKPILFFYDMMSWLEDYDFKVSVYNNGRTLSYKRVKKEDKSQTKLKDFEKDGK